ncbi:MAG: hypothetical protein ABWZ76_07395 [Acidimicrobiales bacterium]
MAGGRRGRRSILLTLAVFVVAVLEGPSTLAAAQAEDWLRFEHRVSYEVDPSSVAVHVRHQLTLTHEQPDRIVGDSIRYTYLPEVEIPVPSGVVDLQAIGAGGRGLSTRLDASVSPLVALAVVDLSPDLRYPDTQTVVLTYDMPAVPPRSETAIRVNQAFVSFPLLLTGDPGLTSLEVRVPDPFTVEVVGDDVDLHRDGTVTVLTAEPSDPGTFLASVLARHEESLLARSVDVGEHEVVVRGWPDDPEWADFAETQVRDGVPALERLIGLPWPATRSIDVLETAAPYLYGYAGWYRPAESRIEVGDELDRQVMLHELGHLWFNDGLFQGRWISEGLAQLFGVAAVEALGGQPARPEPIDPAAPGSLALNDWSDPNLQQDVAQEQEAYGYNAAWSILDQVADEIGIEAIADVVGGAARREIAYAGPGLPDGIDRTFAWTDLLDLLEDRGGSATAAALFEQHVATEAEASRLADRAASRARYAAQAARSGSWEPPVVLRLAMADWRFTEAADLMDTADLILERRDDLDAALAGLDVRAAALEESYETASALPAVDREAATALATAVDLRGAAEAADRSVGPIGALGLLLSSPGDGLSRALDDFEAGRYGEASEAAGSTVDLVDGAVRTGLLRLAVVALVAAAAVLAGRASLRRRRLQRERVAAEMELAALGDPLDGPPAV